MGQRSKNIVILLLSVLIFCGCDPTEQNKKKAFKLFEEGRFIDAREQIDRLYKWHQGQKPEKEIEILLAKMDRIEIDFSKAEPEIRQELLLYFPDLTEEQLEAWEIPGKLEMRLINGEKRYFRNAVPNLFRVDSLARQLKISKEGDYTDPLDVFCLHNTAGLIEKIQKGITPEELTYKFQIDFTITLQPNVVPDGEIIKCWIPFPRESLPRQKNVKLLSVNSDDYHIAGNSVLQRSIYLEKEAVAGQPTVFSFSAEFETIPQWISLTAEKIKPYNNSSDLFKTYTLERPPHIVFSKEIKTLAAEITNGISSPVEKVKAIYYWINHNIPWASALEYSTFENIPEYVLKYRKGDCGMQTLLFMSMARYCGIPCKWQSGWMLHPLEVNLHDWCEIYYEGVGWMPLDQSFGLQNTDNQELKEFYISGIDGYRLVVNDDFSREFDPPKTYYRSEPIDFQRGELEWSGGNLYFNQWTYKLNVTYLNEPEL
jgi:hypothetical protein